MHGRWGPSERGTAGYRGRREGAVRPCRAAPGHPTRPECRLAPPARGSAAPCARFSAPSAPPRAPPSRPLRASHRQPVGMSPRLSLSLLVHLHPMTVARCYRTAGGSGSRTGRCGTRRSGWRDATRAGTREAAARGRRPVFRPSHPGAGSRVIRTWRRPAFRGSRRCRAARPVAGRARAPETGGEADLPNPEGSAVKAPHPPPAVRLRRGAETRPGGLPRTGVRLPRSPARHLQHAARRADAQV